MKLNIQRFKVVVRTEILPRYFFKLRKLLLVTYYSQNSKLKKFSPLKIWSIFTGFDRGIINFKNKRTSHPEILINLTDSLLYGYRTTSNEKIKISPSVTRKITPISGYVTWCKPAARVLQYRKISFKTIASKEIYVLLFSCFVLFV